MQRPINPVWARWDSASPAFNLHEVNCRWPSQLVPLRRAGVLCETVSASDWWCDDCVEHHQVEYHDFPTGRKAIVHCDAGIIRLTADQTDRMALNAESMLRWLFASSRLAIEPMITNHLWKIGRHTIGSRSRELLFVRGVVPSFIDEVASTLSTHPKAILFTPTTGAAKFWRTKVQCIVVALDLAVDLLKQPPHLDWNIIEEEFIGPETISKPTKQRQKRATRTANIERLRDELKRHLHAAADHAVATAETNAGITLLPRPSKTNLAKLTGLSKSDVTRCFADPTATELNLLWQTADDLEAVLRLRGRSTLAK